VTLRSEDVIHSFWVPKLAGTQDVVPGQDEAVYIQADDPGTYWGQCKEFCGASHANMRFLVIADTRADFDAWVEDQKAPAAPPEDELAQRGLDLFMQPQLCIQCHAVNGVEGAGSTFGPDLTHFASRSTFAGAMLENTPEDLRRWLEDSPAVKPGSLMPDYGCDGPSDPAPGPNGCLTADDIDALIAYLQSLE
jgi:cytochrome c oxidase subunit 2